MSNKEKLLASAQKNLQKGQLAKAIKDYQKLVEIEPKEVRNRQKLAELFSRARMPSEALTEYEAVAKFYAGNGFYLKAIAVYKQMQRLAPEEADYYLRLGDLNEKQGLSGNAQAEYRSLVALYEKRELFSEKIDVLQKMKAIEPDNLNIRVKIVESYLEGGMLERAAEEFGEVLDALRKKGDYARIIKIFAIFPPSFVDTPEMKGVLARALIETDETEKGIRLLESLVEKNRDDACLLKTLAQGYRKRGDYDKDRLTLARFHSCSPGDVDCLEDHIRWCFDGKEFSRALEGLEAWKDAFLASGREEVLRSFYEQLASELPEEERVADFLKGHPGFPTNPEGVADAYPGGRGEPCPESEIEDPEDFSVKEAGGAVSSEGGEPLETASGQEAENEEMGEIPLSFLEQVGGGESSLDEQLSEAGEGESGSGGELELDLELFSEHEPLGMEESVGAGDGEDFVELELSVDPLEDILPSVAEFSGAALDPEPGSHLGEDEEGVENDLLGLGEGLEETGAEDGNLPSGGDLKADLEEAEFYLQQGLFSEAEQVCRRVLERAPGRPEAQRMLAELDARRQSSPAAPKKENPSPFNPVADIMEPGPLSEDVPGEAADAAEPEFFALDESISDSQRGVETELALEDTESHYNLGIAYKEMGLLDDAVVEFDRAGNDPSRRVACLTLKGVCFAEKGSFVQAEEAFKSGLGQPDLSAAEKSSLNYETGLLYQALERPLEALDCFQAVADADLFFRDVGEKIESLRKLLGLDNGAEESTEPGLKKKNRVSYV